MTIRIRLIVACMIAIALLPLLCGMAVSDTFSNLLSFQGRLSTPDGKPLPDGSYTVTFRIWDAPSDGSLTWTEHQTVTQVGGTFVAYLGSVTALPNYVFTGGDRWLGIQISMDPELSPRIRLVPSPWAIRAGLADNADTLDGQQGSFYQDASNLTLGTLLDARLSSNVALLNEVQTFTASKYFSARVGIGTLAPQYPLQVENSSDLFGARAIYGLSSSTSTGQQHWGVYGETYSTDASNGGAGVYGRAYSGNSSGLRGETSSDLGAGVFGWATSADGYGYGVRGVCPSPNGYAGYFQGRGYFSSQLNAAGGLLVTGSALLNNSLNVVGTTTLSGLLSASGGITTTTLTTSGMSTLNSLAVTNNATVGGTLSVNGTSTFSGPLTATGGITTTTLAISGNVTIGGTLNANGSGLTNLNASNLSTGTVNDARLSSNVDLLNVAQTITANKTFTGSVGINTSPGTYPLSVLTNAGTNFARAINGVAAGLGTGQQVVGVFGETQGTATANAGARFPLGCAES